MHTTTFRSRWSFGATMALLLLAGHGAAIAQPLADKVPDDALVYLGWRGTDDLGPGYAGSRLKGFVDASAMPALVNDFLPRLIARAAQRDANAAKGLRIASAIVPVLWRHPTAVYVGPIDLAGGRPVPRIAVLCNAGADAASLTNQLKAIVAQVPPNNPVAIRVENRDGLVSLTVGPVDLAGARSLAGRAEFTAAMSPLGKDPVAAMYVDVEAVLALVDANLPPDETVRGIWQVAGDASGLRALKRVSVCAGFDGKDWCTQALVAAPGPRKGLLAMADADPLTDDTLAAIPQTALYMAAGRLDLAKFAAMLHAVAEQVGAQDQFEQVLMGLNGMLGLDVEKDLLAPLGDAWAVYSDPRTGGVGPLGLAMVGHPRDAAKLERSFATLEQLGNRAMAKQGGEFKVAFLRTDVDGLSLHYLNTPFATPSWAIKDGTFYAGLYPQVVSSAAAFGSTKGASILASEGFQSMRDRLGAQRATVLTYVDLPRTAPLSYPFLMAGARVLGVADMWGVQSPPMVLPPLGKLMPLLAPAGSATWTDDAGIHMKSIVPFPGSELLGSPEQLVAPATMLMGLSGYRQARMGKMSAPEALPAAP